MASVHVELIPSSSLERALSALENPAPILGRTLLAFARRVQSITREDYLSGGEGKLKRRTGDLARSVTVDDSELPYAVAVGTDRIYGPVHEFGALIRAKAGGLMRFGLGVNGGAPFRSARVVRIPARPFLAPAVAQAAPELLPILEDEARREAGL